MKSFIKVIKNRDIFGYQINLNFNKQGRTHKTSFGGVLSILTFVFILSFTIMKLSVLFSGEGGIMISHIGLKDNYN